VRGRDRSVLVADRSVSNGTRCCRKEVFEEGDSMVLRQVMSVAESAQLFCLLSSDTTAAIGVVVPGRRLQRRKMGKGENRNWSGNERKDEGEGRGKSRLRDVVSW
jgi:hypothetical protein